MLSLGGGVKTLLSSGRLLCNPLLGAGRVVPTVPGAGQLPKEPQKTREPSSGLRGTQVIRISRRSGDSRVEIPATRRGGASRGVPRSPRAGERAASRWDARGLIASKSPVSPSLSLPRARTRTHQVCKVVTRSSLHTEKKKIQKQQLWKHTHPPCLPCVRICKIYARASVRALCGNTDPMLIDRKPPGFRHHAREQHK